MCVHKCKCMCDKYYENLQELEKSTSISTWLLLSLIVRYDSNLEH